MTLATPEPSSAAEVPSAETPRPETRTDAVRDLEAEFGSLFGHVRRIIAENAERLHPGMLPGAYKVFTTIVRMESVTTSTLAETLIADKAQISRSVRELEELGLVHRMADPDDGRSWLLSPTPDGVTRLSLARAPQVAALTAALQGWPTDDITNLTRLLHSLTAGLSPS